MDTERYTIYDENNRWNRTASTLREAKATAFHISGQVDCPVVVFDTLARRGRPNVWQLEGGKWELVGEKGEEEFSE